MYLSYVQKFIHSSGKRPPPFQGCQKNSGGLPERRATESLSDETLGCPLCQRIFQIRGDSLWRGGGLCLVKRSLFQVPRFPLPTTFSSSPGGGCMFFFWPLWVQWQEMGKNGSQTGWPAQNSGQRINFAQFLDFCAFVHFLFIFFNLV